MPVRKQDAHRALELLEQYKKHLSGPESQELVEALDKAIVAIRSRLFQALLDIHEFYTYTLEDHSKSTEIKTEETLKLAERWEQHPPPVPSDHIEIAKRSLETHMTADGTDFGQKGGAVENHFDEEDWITETVEIQKAESGSLGVSIAGGNDNPHIRDDSGIFITKLIPNTPAEQDGRLQLGDQIMSVNGISLVDVLHLQAVQVLKESGRHVTLEVRRRRGRTWTPVSASDAEKRAEPAGSPMAQPSSPSHYIDVVLIKNDKGLGFSIAGGHGNQHVLGDDGIFITKIIPGGAAEEDASLSVGDRILQVNGQTMVDVTHDEAVAILKSTQSRVVLQVEKNAITNAGLPDDEELEAHGDLEPYTERSVVLQRAEGAGLGFNIIGGEGDTGIFISYISPGSVADVSGKLRRGDQVIEVNSQNMRDATHESAASALKGAGNSVSMVVEYRPREFQEFQLKLQRLQESQQQELIAQPLLTPPGTKPAPVKQLYVRALFDYDSVKDDDRPSQGLSFKHGDILHILNGSDEEWWQAALVGNHADDGPQGLIPSKKRVERRSRANQKSVKFTRGETPTGPDKERKGSASEKRGARSSFKLSMSKRLPFLKKKDSSQTGSDEPKVEDEHIPTYEPVTLEPRGYARPVIILGPMKEDMNDMLVQEFPDKFAGCVPHTTRPARDGEVDARDYHFVSSVEQMERDIQAHLFIEAGRYKDNLYGTSIKAVQEVANQGKHCILGVSGYAIRRLQMADLHPIAVCIRPSSADVIQSAQPRNTEEQCRQIHEKGQRIEQEFAEYFTAVVEGDSLADIYTKVKNVIHEQSGNYIWVPSNEAM